MFWLLRSRMLLSLVPFIIHDDVDQFQFPRDSICLHTYVIGSPNSTLKKNNSKVKINIPIYVGVEIREWFLQLLNLGSHSAPHTTALSRYLPSLGHVQTGLDPGLGPHICVSFLKSCQKKAIQ
ncbi:unnamed protein product [Periconia digitata]|uniref:Uncharacterized protein n=1 Tax=Periconia digitata TaxID=1303443 RepID=A0A9W4UKQ8_9PLEO|nr:unnamed protein product [Periconia digitata]